MPLMYATDSNLVETILHYEELRRKDPRYRLVLCEGDSWFSIGGLTSSVLQEISELDTSDHILLVSCAYSGDTALNMSRVQQVCSGNFSWLLNQWYTTQWDAVLLSMGGNDLIDWLDSESYDLADVGWRQYYSDVLETVRANKQLCPVIAHGYSVPQIEYRKTWWKFWKLGPWLGPRLLKKYPPQKYTDHKREVTRYFREFHSVLRSLEKLYPEFVALLPYEHYRPVTNWQNEIHPARGKGGYQNVAAAFYELILSSYQLAR